MSLIRNYTLILISVFANIAGANVSGVPNLFQDSPALTVPHIVQGRACYSLRASYLDLDCNPAQMATQEKRLFRANLIGNDELSTVNEYRKQLDDDDSTTVAESLLNQDSQLIAKAATSIWYQHDWWAIGIVPVRAGIAYLRRNAAYPEISVHAFKEMELFGKIGLYSSDDQNLKVGFQTRYLRREYVYQEFYALDALTDSSVVKLRHQDALYLEPGITYTWDAEWRPEFSAMLSNLAVYQRGSHMPMDPLIDFGFSSNFFQFKNFRSATHYTHDSDNSEYLRALSWSGIYDHSDLFSVQLTLGKDLFATGIEGHLGFLTLGAAYRNEQMAIDRWASQTVSSFTFEIGLVF